MNPNPFGPLGMTKIRGVFGSCPAAILMWSGTTLRIVPYSEGVIVDREILEGVGEGAA